MTPALTVGQRHSVLLAENLSRALIVQYAGASGDYNPLHHDEPYAVDVAGYPSVIAHGMFTMGLTARLVTDLVGVGHLKTLEGRFRAPVFPGDSLTGHATIVAVSGRESETTVTIDLETFNQHGDLVFSGSAAAAAVTSDSPPERAHA
jgi:peroxisomal enoyl-CoA hydratase 2